MYQGSKLARIKTIKKMKLYRLAIAVGTLPTIKGKTIVTPSTGKPATIEDAIRDNPRRMKSTPVANITLFWCRFSTTNSSRQSKHIRASSSKQSEQTLLPHFGHKMSALSPPHIGQSLSLICSPLDYTNYSCSKDYSCNYESYRYYKSDEFPTFIYSM